MSSLADGDETSGFDLGIPNTFDDGQGVLDRNDEPESEPCIPRRCVRCRTRHLVTLEHQTEIPEGHGIDVCPKCMLELVLEGAAQLRQGA